MTFDQRTIPRLLELWAESGKSHGGIIFVSRKAFAPNDLSGLAICLVAFWDAYRDLDWTDRLAHLRRI